MRGRSGLSVSELEGGRFWSWCTYDILGVFSAPNASGRVVADSKWLGLAVCFARDRPVGSDVVLFRPTTI